MSYQPTEWTTGDVVTPQKLNKIEDGIQAVEASVEEVAASVQELENTKTDILVINISESEDESGEPIQTMDKTAREIIAAFPDCIVKEGDRTYSMAYYDVGNSGYGFATWNSNFFTSSLDGYPLHGTDK